MGDVLADEEVQKRLPEGWEREGNEIVRTFDFDSYLAGVGFASGVAGLAEEAWHHPEMTITWGSVEVRLTTHDAGGITGADLDLAERMTNVYD